MKTKKPNEHIALNYSQNFLKSSALVEKLIIKSGIGPHDVVVEIGPGKGRITRALAERCKKVIAIEKDPLLYHKLVEVFKDRTNVNIIFGDILSYPLPLKGDYKVFSNIPFNLTSDILNLITSAPNPPDGAYLIVQSEAAVKFAGHPYGEERFRSLQLKPWFDISITHRFRRTDFLPVPHVDTVMLSIKKRSKPLLEAQDRQDYYDFLAYIFNRHGKNFYERVKHIITKAQFKRLSVDLKFQCGIRPGDLNINQWIKLFSFFKIHATESRKMEVQGSARILEKQQKNLIKTHRTFLDAKTRKLNINL